MGEDGKIYWKRLAGEINILTIFIYKELKNYVEICTLMK